MKKVFDFYAKTGKKDKEGFNDALPIGNGRMGGMIYGHPVNEKIVLNADSLWLGKPG
ncbi:MAG: glycoside hydrolase N-terminal domain-containing protein, partial [Acholeplasmatales bacterium]|nr:glycoside hydrolase N-terminal domain-containing protein [Acholeplasmatales bacterium]